MAKHNIKTTKNVYKTLILQLTYQSKYETIKCSSALKKKKIWNLPAVDILQLGSLYEWNICNAVQRVEMFLMNSRKREIVDFSTLVTGIKFRYIIKVWEQLW